MVGSKNDTPVQDAKAAVQEELQVNVDDPVSMSAWQSPVKLDLDARESEVNHAILQTYDSKELDLEELEVNAIDSNEDESDDESQEESASENSLDLSNTSRKTQSEDAEGLQSQESENQSESSSSSSDADSSSNTPVDTQSRFDPDLDEDDDAFNVEGLFASSVGLVNSNVTVGVTDESTEEPSEEVLSSTTESDSERDNTSANEDPEIILSLDDEGNLTNQTVDRNDALDSSDNQFDSVIVGSPDSISPPQITLSVSPTSGTVEQNGFFTLDILNDSGDIRIQNVTIINSLDLDEKGVVSITDNQISYDPGNAFDYLPEGQSENVVIRFIATDVQGNSVESAATIEVTGTNDAPVLGLGSGTTDQDTTLALDVLASASDPEDDVLTLSNVSLDSGLGSVSIINNELVYDPAGNYDGLNDGQSAEVVVSYTVTDATGETSQSTATISVTGTNDAPVLGLVSGTTDQDTTLTVDVLAGAIDPEGEILTLSNVSLDSGLGSVSIVNNELVYDPAGNYDSLADGQSAEVVVSYTVTDATGETSQSTATISVTGTNDAPVLGVVSGTTDQNAALTVDVLASASDPEGDVLSLSYVSLDSGLGLVSIVDNELVYDPAGNYDGLSDGQSVEVVVSYTVTDATGETSQSTVSISVTGANYAPVLAVVSDTTDQDTTLTVDVLAGASDPEGDVLTVSNVVIDSGLGSVSIVNNELVYDPAGNYDGLASGQSAEVVVTYTVTDEGGNSVDSTATISVTGTDDAPVLGVVSGTTDQDTSLTIDVLASASDPEGDVLTLSNVTLDSGLGSVSIVGNELVYDPAGNYDSLADGQNAEVVVSYTVTDATGETSQSTATISVTGTNDAPILSAISDTTDQDTSLTIDVLASASDPEGDVLTLSNVTLDSGLGSVSIVNNELVYDPAGNYDSLADGQSTEVVVSYTVTDATGETSQSTATISVTGTNDAPILSAISDTTDQDTSLTIDVLASASDPEGDVLTLSNVTIDSGLGSVSIVGNELVYDPAGNYDSLADGQSAEVIVSYTVTDATGETSQSTATISVSGTNDAPVLGVVSDTTDQDTSLTVDVLASASDPEGDVLTLSNVTLDSGLGSVSIVNNELVYDPAGNYDSLADGQSAEVVVSYTVTDATGETSQSTATISVTGLNAAPILQADSGVTAFSDSLTLDVLANDTDPDTSDTLTITDASISSGSGTVTIVSNELLFDPDGQYDSLRPRDTSSVDISYTVEDSAGESALSTATIQVNGWNNIVQGTADADVLVSESGRTLIYGGEGTDSIEYNVGDGYDYISGGDGADVLTVNATTGSNLLIEDAATYNSRTGLSVESNLIMLTVDGSVAAEIEGIEQLNLNADATDSITISGDFTQSDLVVNGLIINSVVTDVDVDASLISSNHGIQFNGTSGSTTTIGGQGDDVFEGGGDADSLAGGAGNDLFNYNVGEGFDFIDGGVDQDTLVFESPGLSVVLVETAFIFNLRTGSSIPSDHFVVSVNTVPAVQAVNIENFEIHAGDNDHILLVGDFSSTTLSTDIQILGATQNTIIDGSQILSDHSISVIGDVGAETVIGTINADVIASGDGDDILQSIGAGDVVSTGQGSDAISAVIEDGLITIDSGLGSDLLTLDCSGVSSLLIEDAASYLLRTGESLIDAALIITADNTTSLLIDSVELLNLNVDLATNTILSGDLSLAGLDTNGLNISVIGGGSATVDVSNLASIHELNSGLSDGLTLVGDLLSNTITGTVNDDYIDGLTGSDILSGGSGHDTLINGLGNDQLFGEAGDDLFVMGLLSGVDVADGGIGWTDTIDVLAGVATIASLEINGVVTAVDIFSDGIDLSADSFGSVTLIDGSYLDFTNMERIDW